MDPSGQDSHPYSYTIGNPANYSDPSALGRVAKPRPIARDIGTRPTRITAKTGNGTTAVDIGYTYGANGLTAPADDRENIQTRTAFAEQGITAGAVTT